MSFISKESWCEETKRDCFLKPLIDGPRKREFEEIKTCEHCQKLHGNDMAIDEMIKG